MIKQEATDKAIERIKGQEIEPGKIVGCQSRELTMTLLRYEGDNAICEDVNDGEVSIPRSELSTFGSSSTWRTTTLTWDFGQRGWSRLY